jgi:hypothetical protein
MFALKTAETISDESVNEEEKLYAQAHYRSWPS